jgi:hypothetical protein
MTTSKDAPIPDSLMPSPSIKGFTISSKNGAATKKKPQLSSHLGKRPRSTFAHGDDSEEEDERVVHEVVTGFGENGAVKEVERAAQGPLVIERLGNTRVGPTKASQEVLRRRGAGMKNLLPAEVLAARERAHDTSASEGEGKGSGLEIQEVLNGGKEEVKWGLDVSVRKRVKSEDIPGEDDSKIEAAEGDTNGETENKDGASTVKTADEEALAALLGEERKKNGPDLVIQSLATLDTNSLRQDPISEEDAYRRAIAAAPDVSTLEDYERVPVEEFGAALLRGMGWKGEKNGGAQDGKAKKRWEVKRRQNLLGLGAKELKDAEELGAWVQRSDVKRLKPGAPASGSGGSGGRDGKVRVSDYRREEERRRERREERGGGSYRRERERERDERDYDRRDRDRRR